MYNTNYPIVTCLSRSSSTKIHELYKKKRVILEIYPIRTFLIKITNFSTRYGALKHSSLHGIILVFLYKQVNNNFIIVDCSEHLVLVKMEIFVLTQWNFLFA